ncbi:MAG: hypothetical protein WA182_06880 [Candidatus Sulfotelmatobacter sp.]
MTTAYVYMNEHLAGCFKQERYDGSYHDATGFPTPEAEEAAASFRRLSADRIQWCQVHGDLKNAAKRVLFQPYRHWPELYESCRLVVKATLEMRPTQDWNESVAARVMGDVMTVMRKKYGLDVPKWWFPILKILREAEAK